MITAYDLYSETNPAFISFLLYRFVKSFNESDDRLPNFSLSFLVIPLAISERVEPSFAATNSATGFLAWVNRFPEIRVGLQRDVEFARDITVEGIRLAIASQLIAISDKGDLRIGPAKRPPENIKSKLPQRPKDAVARAERLGKWMANAGSPSLIFSALEVTP